MNERSWGALWERERWGVRGIETMKEGGRELGTERWKMGAEEREMKDER